MIYIHLLKVMTKLENLVVAKHPVSLERAQRILHESRKGLNLKK